MLGMPCRHSKKDNQVSPERRISIVEDDESLRAALVGLVRSLGYSAEGFASAEDYLAGDDGSDCVVADIQLPGLSGIALAERLRASGNAVPVIMITARTEPRLEQSALDCGAICLLRKPFDVEALVDVLERAVETGGARGGKPG